MGIDILIVGAGPSGLCAAKTFLQQDPNATVQLVDAFSTLGGVWSKQQLYPTLKTNNLYGSVDFTDFPMDARFGIKEGEHITGEVMHAYLAAYAEHFGLTGRIRFNAQVRRIRRLQRATVGANTTGWAVEVETAGQSQLEVLECVKLVVATGILSVPNTPDLPGADQFNARILHSSEFGPEADLFLANTNDVQTIGVIGGGKSSYDTVYLAASTGHKVDWVIRKSGRGPVWVFPPHTYLGPFKAWRERLVTRRFLSFMSPCMFPDFSGIGWFRRILHETWLGKLVSTKFWDLIKADTINDIGYKTDTRFDILQPEQNPFWYGTATGVLNYEKDFFSFVRNGQVRIHREDVSHLSDHAVHLADGSKVEVDALVLATGYSAKPKIKFEPESLHSELGIPSDDLSKSQQAFWSTLDAQADVTIGTRFPRLLSGPFRAAGSSTPKPYNPGQAAETSYTPWRLYRGIAPPGLAAEGDRSLVFLGMCSNIANILRLEIQCLWALAYLSDKLPSLARDVSSGRVFDETALQQRFTQHRAPYGHGRIYPDLVFDQLPYWDVLLHDLGLPTARKSNLVKELFEPYTQADYRGLVGEWLCKNDLKAHDSV